MKTYCIGVAVALFVASGSTFQDASSSASGSVLDGVFTADQAKLGERRFQVYCSSCHTPSDHSGGKFTARWADTTLNELFDFMSTTMPEGNPGALQPAEYASIIAFFLRETGYPEGKPELPADSAALAKIRVEPPTPK